MSEVEVAAQLRETGVALLRATFAADLVARLRAAAARCFEAVEMEASLAERYGFNRFSHSLPLTALAAFGCDMEDLTAPITAPGLSELFAEAMGPGWACRMEHSWVRKKFAPLHASDRQYHFQGWHQDGALGVPFPAEPGAVLPMTELLTCWIPLDPCGVDSPGLECVRGSQPGLLHFTELGDLAIRQRFPAEKFLAPELAPGDGLVFLNSTLHRTHVSEAMQSDRISVEYRIFPR